MTESYTLVVQSFGREHEYRRAIFTVLSFYAFADKGIPAILFTDRPDYFEPYFTGLPVSYILLTPEKIKQMRGDIDFLHRMKIALIEEAMAVSGTTLFYTDSDTFFTADPGIYVQRTSAAQSFMHLHEYQFEEVRHMPLPAGKAAQAFIRYIEENEVYIPGTDIRITARMSSWNAGVILLHQSNKALIEKVYQLTDKFFPACHSHASEQYAFSIVLQEMTGLEPLDSVVYHYWYNIKKKVMDEYLAAELDKTLGMDLHARMSFVQQAIQILPGKFMNHIDALKDNAIQAFNEQKYGEGLRWTLKAFAKGGLGDGTFVKDFLYHSKVRLGKTFK